MNHKTYLVAAMISMSATLLMAYLFFDNIESGEYGNLLLTAFAGSVNFYSYRINMKSYHRGRP